jgi:hypothetical protein
MISNQRSQVFAPLRLGVRMFSVSGKGKADSRKGAKAQSIPIIDLILRRPLDVIDNDCLHRTFGRFKFESNPLDRSEDAGKDIEG